MEKKKVSVVNIIEGIVVAILILLIAGMLFLYFSFSKTGAAPDIFGYTIYHTKAVSMQPEIPAGAAVIAQKSEIDSIKAGSVVLCKIGEDTILTRVVQLLNEGGEMSYVVKFDTAPADNTFKISKDNIVAKATWISEGFGAVLNFATSTLGIMLVIIIPSFIVIIFQVVRIINVKKAEEEAVSLDDLDEVMMTGFGDSDDESDFDEPDDDESGADIKEEAEKPSETVFEPMQNSKKKDIAFDFSVKNDENDDKDRDILSFLNVNKNGKAELSAERSDDLPLFTYDNLKKDKSEKDKGFSAPEPRDFSHAFDEKKDMSESRDSSSFMSNVLPEKIVNAVSESENPAPVQPKAPVPVAVKPVREDKHLRNESAIPPKAALPKEKLAPPRKSTGKTISDLMSLIDAEESKLK